MSILEDLEVAASHLNLGEILAASLMGLEDQKSDTAQPTDANVTSHLKVEAVPHSSPVPSSTPLYSTMGTSTHTHSSGLSTQSHPMSTTSVNNSSSMTLTSASQTTLHGSSQSVHYPSQLVETPGRNKNKFYVVIVRWRTGIFDNL